MATLKNRIELEDGVSPVLRVIRGELSNVSPGFSAMKMRANDAMDSIAKTSVPAVSTVADIREEVNSVSEAVQTIPEGHVTLRERGITAVHNALNSITTKLRTDVVNASHKAEEAITGFFGKFTLANLAADAIGKLLGFIASIPGTLMKTSAEYTSIQARIKLITESQEQVVDMNNAIFDSAIKARGSYASMADAVSKIAMTAKEAFPDPKTVVPFLEGIQKLFVIGGTAAQQQGDAMLQLTQALGSGKFQGDEFRSIAEAAPMIEQTIAKYMGVTQGDLKQLASQGEVTAEVMKNAILSNMDDINAKFNQMPKTWGDIWTELKNRAINAFSPILVKISELANSPAVEALKNGIGDAMEVAAAAIIFVIGVAGDLWNVLYSIGSYLATWFEAGFDIIVQGFEAASQYSDIFFSTVIMGLSLYAAYLAITNIQLTSWMMEEAAMAVWHGITSAALAVKNAVLWVYNLRTKAAALLTRGWALVTMVMAGAQAVLNAVLAANPIGIVIGLVILVIGAFAAWAVATNGVRASIASAFRTIANIVAEVINFIIDRINDAIDAINALAKGINGVFHTSIGIIGRVEHVNQNGDWGDKAYDTVMDFDIHKLLPSNLTPKPVTEDIGTSGVSGIPSYGDMTGASTPDLSGAAGNVGKIADSSAQTAENTSEMVDNLNDISDQVKDLRDLALQNSVTNWQITHNIDVKIDQQNTIEKDADIDGMTNSFVEGLKEALAVSPERPERAVLT